MVDSSVGEESSLSELKGVMMHPVHSRVMADAIAKKCDVAWLALYRYRAAVPAATGTQRISST